MPLEAGELYTDVEIEIMRFLGNSRPLLTLYETLRKTRTNPNFLIAVASFKVLNYRLRSEQNFAGEVCGSYSEYEASSSTTGRTSSKLLQTSSNCRNLQIDIHQLRQPLGSMDDLAMLEREMALDKQTVRRLSEDAMRFGLIKMTDNQTYFRKLDTHVMDLNMCSIDQVSSGFDNYKELLFKFNDFVGKCNPVPDIFEKKFILVPIFYRKESYLTVITDPIGAVKHSDLEPYGTCKMYHIGTKNLNEYKQSVVPRIMKLMKLFLQLFRGSKKYADFLEDTIEVADKVLPVQAFFEKPVQLLYMINEFLGIKNDIRETASIFNNIGADRKTMMVDMATVRKSVGTDFVIAINESNSRAGKHLLQVREEIKRHLEAQPPAQPSEDDVKVEKEELEGEPTRKRQRFN